MPPTRTTRRASKGDHRRLQVGHTGPLCPSEPRRPIPYLDEVVLDVPELTIVGGHIGSPWTTEMLALATKMITPCECLAALDELELSAPAREAFMGGNAQRVFGLKRLEIDAKPADPLTFRE